MTGYPAGKLYHKAAKIADDGAISALCYKKPKPINLRLASWTLRDSAVTCPRCKKKMAGLHLTGQV